MIYIVIQFNQSLKGNSQNSMLASIMLRYNKLDHLNFNTGQHTSPSIKQNNFESNGCWMVRIEHVLLCYV